MKIKVLPIYPEFPLTFWSFKSAIAYRDHRALMTPVGSASVAAMLPSDRFDAMPVMDLNVQSVDDKQIRESDIIFTTTMNAQEASHNEVIDRVHFYGKKLVAGGPFPTACPDRNSKADVIAAGEAGLILKPLLEDLVNGNPRKIYTEQYALESGRFDEKKVIRFVENGMTKIKPSLHYMPVPRWDLLKLNLYEFAGIQYSTGCPFNCEFCDIIKFWGRNPRTKTVNQMTGEDGEFDALYSAGYRGEVMILDDNIMANAKNLRAFLPATFDWQEGHGFPFKFVTQASVNLAWDENKDILENMVRAGFEMAFVGYESVDRDALKAMHKNQNLMMSPLEATRRLQRAGLNVTGGFIVGSDNDKETVFDDLFKFIQEAGIVVPMIGLLTALDGTDLYNRLRKEGRLRQHSTGNNVHHLSFNFEPKLDEEFLINGYVDLLDRMFSPGNYFARCKTLLENLGESKIGESVTRQEVIAFERSLARQIFAKGGLEYAKHLARTLVHHPRKFPYAVAQGIYLDHLGKITRAAKEVQEYQEKTESLYERFKYSVERAYAKYFPDKNLDTERARSVENKIGKYAARVISSAEKKYLKLHKDFRADAGKFLKSFRDRIYGEVKKLNSA